MPSLPHLRRRQFFAFMAGGWALPPLAFAKDSALPVPTSLPDAALAATARGEPLVLLVSLPACPYCELVRRSYLLPMRADGLPAWQVSISDRTQPVRDFSGQPSSGAALAARWKIRVTPTVLFLDGKGVEIAPRLEGIAVPDFYGAYLDDALVTARKRLKGLNAPTG